MVVWRRQKRHIIMKNYVVAYPREICSRFFTLFFFPNLKQHCGL
jgi:hypothetical protein